MTEVSNLQTILDKQFNDSKQITQSGREAMIQNDQRTLIVCAAAMSPTGLVVTSVRHGDHLFYGVIDYTINEREHYHDWIQGFVTNTYAFVTRKEAWIIAERQGQIRNKLGCDSSKRLYSENLY